jgi:lipopolysaccharide biosynthesis regulator YciM
LKTDWRRHVLASSGYLELGMFDDAALVLEEIAPEDKNRNEVLGARVNLYMVAKKWDMAAAVASHLVKVDPGTAGWWISLAYALRRTESVEKAEAILLRAQTIHPKVAMIAFNLACYASVAGRMEDAKERLCEIAMKPSYHSLSHWKIGPSSSAKALQVAASRSVVTSFISGSSSSRPWRSIPVPAPAPWGHARSATH